MLIRFLILLIPVLAGGLLSCKQQECGADFKELQPGLCYRFFVDHDGEEADTSDVIVVDMITRSESGTVLRNTFREDAPREARIRSKGKRTLVEEGFAMLSEGDSVEFKVRLDSLFDNNEEVPPVLDSGEYVSYLIKVRKVQNREAYFSAKKEQRKKEINQVKQKIREDARAIDAYLREEGIEADSLSNGIRYKFLKKGKGPLAEKGDSLTVHYDASYFRGKQFSSSGDKEPYKFVLGSNKVIRGLSLGLKGVPQGSKIRLYIPSPLAYGEEGVEDIIPPDKILVFEVEVLDINKKNSSGKSSGA